MVVVAVIAIVTGIIISGVIGSKTKSRDAKRSSDLSQIVYALGQYFDKCNQYPSAISTTTANGCPSGVTLGSFMSTIPSDPTPGHSYGYSATGTPPGDYVLYTTFETTNSAVSQSAPNPGWFSVIACTTGLNFCVRPD